MLGQAVGLPPQVTSQAHAEAQSIDGHAPWPAQVTEHDPGPQLMLWHADAPVHWMSQLAAAPQSMSPQASELLHWMVQSKPDGQ